MYSTDSTFRVYTAKEKDASVGWVHQFDEYVAVATVPGINGSARRVFETLWRSYWRTRS